MIFNDSIYNKNWQIYSLSELGDFARGKSKHRPRNDIKLFKNGSIPFIQTGEIKDSNLYICKNNEFYNEFGLKQSKLWDRNTLCITIAANIAETALLSYPACFPDSVVGFKSNDLTSEMFMYYVFKYIKNEIQKRSSGSTQDNINIEYLQTLKFRIPQKSDQNKILSILLNIDKKINLNVEINKNLEYLAKTLYDYWFLQFEFPNEEGKPYKSSGGKMVYNNILKKEIPGNWDVKQLKDLVAGKKVSIPEYNFALGVKEYNSPPVSITPDTIILIEGLHAINDKMTPDLDANKKYKIFLSPLMGLNIDKHNYISINDVRLMRRIVRDNRTRATDVGQTICYWNIVRNGEEKNIYPFVNDVDTVINTSLAYEVGVLKVFVEPLLYSVTEDSLAYTEARRIIESLSEFYPIPSDYVPDDSILREFIGKSIFESYK